MRIFMKSLAGLLVLVFLAGCSAARFENRTLVKQTTQSKPVSPEKKIYRCLSVTNPIKIDGILDEPAWQETETVNFVIPKSFNKPVSKTEAKLLSDNNYLYVAFTAYDQDIFATYTTRDIKTWEEDVLEIFFKTDPDKNPYYEFEVSPLGTVFDAFYAKRGASGNLRRWSDWNCKGLKAATKVNGTLNNWHGKDVCWTLEVAIPFANLPTLSGKSPHPGDVWLFNLTRYDYSVYLPDGRELSSYSPLSYVDFNLYEDWATLIFD